MPFKTIEVHHEVVYSRFKEAIEIQDACNMRAIARQFVLCVDDAMAELQDTGAVWRDPAVRLFVNKLESLSNSADTFSDAYAECKRRVPAWTFTNER